MRFKLMSLTLFLTLVFTVAPALAQTNLWSVILMNNEQKLVRVYADGMSELYDPGLAGNASDLSISPDGNLLAYCATDYTDAQNPTFVVKVHELATNSQLLEYALGKRLGCNLGQVAFSPDADQVSVGVLNYYDTDPSADTTLPIWELLSIDVATGALLHTLTELSPEAQAFTATVGYRSLMPDIRAITASTITAALVPWATHGVDSPALTWDLQTNTVTSTPEWGALNAATLATSEGVTHALIGLDETLPAGEAGGPLPSSNRVQMIEPGSEPVTIYINTADLPIHTEFVNNGSTLAVQVLEGFDSAQPDVIQSNYWLGINRDGSITTITEPNLSYSVLRAAPDGYVILAADTDTTTGVSTFKLDYTGAAGSPTTLWDNSGATSSGSFWEILWVTPSTIGETLPPFLPAS